MLKTKIVIFDFDGVIFDSKKANIAYYDTLLNHLELPKMTEEQTDYVHVHTVDEAVIYLIKNKKLIMKVQSYKEKIDYDAFIKLMEIEPTLLYVMKKLRINFKTAIATNRTNTVKEILNVHGISKLFDFVVCSSDVAFPKPNPCMLNKVMEYFEISRKEAIYIGDSKLDEEASRLAKIPFIAYNNADLNADFYIDSLVRLEKILSLKS